jgi:hypothetical protein
MPDLTREERREALQSAMEANYLTRQHVCELLHISPDGLKAWLKPETAAGSNPVPLWALELLHFKMKAKDDARELAMKVYISEKRALAKKKRDKAKAKKKRQERRLANLVTAEAPVRKPARKPAKKAAKR